jgi:hypothetical protein
LGGATGWTANPEVFQWVKDRVKPERDQNNRATYRENWWIFGEPRGKFRPSLNGLHRYIATVETSKHRFFTFFDQNVLPDNKLIAIALDDSFFLGVLSSRIHVCWALSSGSHLGVGNDPVYVKTACFDKYPFPLTTDEKKKSIGDLADRLDAHRKRQLDLNPRLTMTDMYNVLEKIKGNEALTESDRIIYDQGLIAVLKEIHDDLDVAVLEAYGLPVDASDSAILTELVDLNSRAADVEKRGIIRWLRPEFQAVGSSGAQPEEPEEGNSANTEAPATKSKNVKQLRWPASIPDQVRLVRGAISNHAGPFNAELLASRFEKKAVKPIVEILETLVLLGQLRKLPRNTYSMIGR